MPLAWRVGCWIVGGLIGWAVAEWLPGWVLAIVGGLCVLAMFGAYRLDGRRRQKADRGHERRGW